MAVRLTDKLVRTLEPPPLTNGRGNNRITYDTNVPGFGVRITSAGAVSFVLNYRRKADGLERRYTIGAFPNWSVGAARDEARRLKREIDSGGDPVGKLKTERGAPTVADLCARFEAEHLPKLRPATARMYRGIIKADIAPALGKMKVAAVEYVDIDRLHTGLSKRAPYLANRVTRATEQNVRARDPMGNAHKQSRSRSATQSGSQAQAILVRRRAYPPNESAGQAPQ